MTVVKDALDKLVDKYPDIKKLGNNFSRQVIASQQKNAALSSDPSHSHTKRPVTARTPFSNSGLCTGTLEKIFADLNSSQINTQDTHSHLQPPLIKGNQHNR